jgi:hypothetical protein
MADPRKTVAFDGIGERNVTMKIDNSTIVYDKTKAFGSAQVGLAVVLSTDRTVKLSEDAEIVHGKLQEVYPDNLCSVQVEGYMELPGGNGATLTVGSKIVGALGAASAKGYVRTAAATAAEALAARGQIIDNDDTTKVIVKL